jgi:hypothetical protein
VANLVDYFSDRKPNLYIYIKSLLVKDVLSSTIEVEYNTFYRQVLHTQKTKIS